MKWLLCSTKVLMEVRCRCQWASPYIPQHKHKFCGHIGVQVCEVLLHILHRGLNHLQLWGVPVCAPQQLPGQTLGQEARGCRSSGDVGLDLHTRHSLSEPEGCVTCTWTVLCGGEAVTPPCARLLKEWSWQSFSPHYTVWHTQMATLYSSSHTGHCKIVIPSTVPCGLLDD